VTTNEVDVTEVILKTKQIRPGCRIGVTVVKEGDEEVDLSLK